MNVCRSTPAGRRTHLSSYSVCVWPTALLYYGYCVATVIDSAALQPGARNRRRVLRLVLDRKSDLHRCFGAVSILPTTAAATFGVRRQCSCHAQLFALESARWPPRRRAVQPFRVRAAVSRKADRARRSGAPRSIHYFNNIQLSRAPAYNWQSSALALAAKCNRIVVIVIVVGR